MSVTQLGFGGRSRGRRNFRARARGAFGRRNFGSGGRSGPRRRRPEPAVLVTAAHPARARLEAEIGQVAGLRHELGHLTVAFLDGDHDDHVAQHVLVEAAGLLELIEQAARGAGHVEVKDDVVAVFFAIDFVGQPAAPPTGNLADGGTASVEDPLKTLDLGVDLLVADLGVEDDHRLVVANFLTGHGSYRPPSGFNSPAPGSRCAMDGTGGTEMDSVCESARLSAVRTD